jgi:short-subunit dehydrogenase
MKSDQFKRSLEVNVLGSFNLNHVLMGDMVAENDGMIVTVSSATSMFGGARLCDYAASKWALQGFHESLRLELRAGMYVWLDRFVFDI